MEQSVKKWKRIGWLMLAGEIVLLLFLGQWLRAQYEIQERRLYQDIKSLFARTEQKLTDSLLNRTIAVVLNAPEGGPHKVKVQISTSFTVDTALSKDSFFHIKSLPQHPDNDPVASWDQDTAGIHIKNMMIGSRTGKGPLPENVQKVLRMAIVQTASNRNLSTMGFTTSADSVSFFMAFDEELQKKTGLSARWDTLPQDSGKIFLYSSRSYTTPLAIKGYRAYLLRSILPQTGFSLVLLLLIGLAFWLAYRMMRQQARFNRQKDSFINNISHELKTPVATTKVALEALTTYQGIDDPERTRKYLKVASWEMDRLSNMIDRIMNIIQTESGNLVLDRKPVPLKKLVEELVAAQQPLLNEKGITVTQTYGAGALVAFADRMHLQGVLYNLLDNAVKYGGSMVGIEVRQKEGEIILTIRDNGPGIPAEYQHKVFEHFFRVPSGNRHDVKGHGLGLSYARDIILAHQGSLELESKTGEGAAFIIRLPLNPSS